MKRYFIVYYLKGTTIGLANVECNCDGFPSFNQLQKELGKIVVTGITELCEQDYKDWKS